MPYFSLGLTRSSRSETVGAAEQELGVLDGQAAEQHGQAVDAQTEAAVGRAAVLEELQIELDILGQALLLGLASSAHRSGAHAVRRW